jgi:3-deoxy-D-manno-oct-2-ulosonic acid (Kdo) hydroxylase
MVGTATLIGTRPNVIVITAGGSYIAALETIGITHRQGPFADVQTSCALSSLEHGNVVYFPELTLLGQESYGLLFSPALVDDKVKNISYNPGTDTIKGTIAAGRERLQLQTMMAAFSLAATRFVAELFPSYAASLERGRASYRPVEIADRQYSRLKDDRLLHVDAFPSTPTQGRRILRFFSNVSSSGKSRIWHIGEPFAEFAQRFLPVLRRPRASLAWFLSAVGATRGRRTAYDQLMLGLHNRAKRDAAYQERAPHQKVAFPAGSNWLCFTDQVVHAAVAGQYALEQTFYLDVEAMAEPDLSPARTLERMTRRKLC